jgi:type II secretory pathway pseudopilin PulG
MMAISRRAARRGLTITELVISLGMLSSLCMLVAQWFVVTAAGQAREQEQHFAVQAAANLMEQLFAQPWDALTQDNSDALAARAFESATEYECAVKITDVPPDDAGLRGRRIYLRVAHRAGRIPPLELMAWRHAKGQQSGEEEP